MHLQTQKLNNVKFSNKTEALRYICTNVYEILAIF